MVVAREDSQREGERLVGLLAGVDARPLGVRRRGASERNATAATEPGPSGRGVADVAVMGIRGACSSSKARATSGSWTIGSILARSAATFASSSSRSSSKRATASLSDCRATHLARYCGAEAASFSSSTMVLLSSRTASSTRSCRSATHSSQNTISSRIRTSASSGSTVPSKSDRSSGVIASVWVCVCVFVGRWCVEGVSPGGIRLAGGAVC